MTTNDPNPKERFDYLAPWEEDWYDESNPFIPHDTNLLDGEMDMEPEFVLDTAQYWEDYGYIIQVHAVLDLANEILEAAAPSVKDEPK